MFDFSYFSDPVDLEAAFVRVGDYVEWERIRAPLGHYEGREITRGIVMDRSETAALDGKLRFDLVDALKQTVTLRLRPDDSALVRRPDPR